MKARQDVGLLYTSSQQRAACVVAVDPTPPLRVRLLQRGPDAPAFAGYRMPPMADCGGRPPAQTAETLAPSGATLLPLGSWETPPFTPHRRDVHAFLSLEPGASQGSSTGGWACPAATLDAWARHAPLEGGDAAPYLLDTPTLTLLRALEAPLDDVSAQAVAHRLSQALQGADAPFNPGGLGPLSQAPHEVRPGVWLLPLHTPTLPPATHTNCLIVGERELILIDPASPWPEHQQQLQRVLKVFARRGAAPVAIALTHHHPDHVGGAVALKQSLGLPIWAHATTARLLEGKVPVDRMLTDGEELPLSGALGLRLRCLFTPGHAPGHLCFHELSTDTLIAGDMVAGWGTIAVAPPEGDLGRYLRELERLADLDPAAVLPAHGPALAHGRLVFTAFRAHRLKREAQLVEALRGGPMGLAALTRAVYHDVPAWVLPMAEAAVLGHLLKLEDDGRLQARLDGTVALRNL